MELREPGTNRRALLSEDGKEDSDRTGWNRGWNKKSAWNQPDVRELNGTGPGSLTQPEEKFVHTWMTNPTCHSSALDKDITVQYTYRLI